MSIQGSSVVNGHLLIVHFIEDAHITKGENEVAKSRASTFYGLKQGEFVVFADGKDRKVRFKLPNIHQALPSPMAVSPSDLQANYRKVHSEVRSIFK